MSVTSAPAAPAPAPAAAEQDRQGRTGWGHHASLDGVRTIAVYLVLVFHCGVGAVSGGFVGVDLFFVLSGFLVSSILLEEIGRTGTIRVGRFYARRVRRLLPAAVVVVAATSAASVLVLSVVRRLPLVGDAQSALLYFSNWRFLSQSNDYFAADGVDQSPFLHFWSLSIEEQFYVAFPLVLLALAWLDRRWRRATLVGIAVLFGASVAAQLVWAAVDADQAYYGTGARLYQLLAGVLAALLLRSRFRPRGRGIGMVAVVSLACLLVVASGLVDVTPSWRGLLATVVSVSLILGLMGSDDGLLARALARPTPAYLGKISYGTYLWHWPVIILFGELMDLDPLALVGFAGVVATALAALSYAVLEMPIRRAPLLQPITWPTVAVGVALSVLVAVTVVPDLLRSEHRPALASAGAAVTGSAANREGPVPSDVDWEEYVEDRGADDTACTLNDADNCVIVDGDGPHVMLVGDSHARMIAPTLAKLARLHGFKLSVSLQEGCPWQLGVYNAFDSRSAQRRCAEIREETFDDVIPNTDVDLVILSQIARDTDAWRDHLLSVDKVPGETLEQRLVRTIDDTLTAVHGAGARALIIDSMLGVPWDQDPPLDCLASATDLAQCRVPVPIESPPTDGFYQAAAATDPGVFTVNVNPIMCPAAPVCDPMTGEVPVWKDRKHYAPKALDLHRDEIWQAMLDSGALDGFDLG
ncbi:acyltransferase family protein [Nocardioides sp. YIM 152315]|uniref:acyltransferase family protein n=1 Tax=Nocardioides sp. YIM 152315 TaxID=3031760 RepID=UPI0023DB690E|nr:acyltransferase family protein [Nocardioides sp. YIM 152315]MDF1602641.1 acyltransferase family protein [Nocardioides sp. YIM 152315]